MTSRDVPGAAAEGLWAPRAAARAGSSEQVLAALDPEQRAGRARGHGPVVVLAGAGTGKTRAITHRIAYGVAHRPARPASHAGRHLHHARRRRDARTGSPRWASRACRRAPSTRRRCGSCATSGRAWSAGGSPEILPSKARILAPMAASRRGVSTDSVARARRRRRDRVGEGRARSSPPTTSAARSARGASRRARSRHAERRRALSRRTTTARRADGFIDFEDVLLLTVGILDTRPDIADEVRRGLPLVHRRRVPGRQPAAAAAARPVARRARRPVRGRRREPDDLHVHRCELVLPASTSARGSRTPPRFGSCAPTAPRRRSSGWPTACSRARPGADVAAQARAARQRADGAEPAVTAYDDELAEAAATAAGASRA